MSQPLPIEKGNTVDILDLFKRKCRPNKAKSVQKFIATESVGQLNSELPSRGIYIWRVSYAIRFLLVGNEPLTGGEIKPGSHRRFQQLRLDLGRLRDPNFQLDSDDVRIYPDYVAIDIFGVSDLEELVDKATDIIGKHVGWSDVPQLGAVHSTEHYLKLSSRHGHRWPLGRHY